MFREASLNFLEDKLALLTSRSHASPIKISNKPYTRPALPPHPSSQTLYQASIRNTKKRRVRGDMEALLDLQGYSYGGKTGGQKDGAGEG
jgi:hypothetical protein